MKKPIVISLGGSLIISDNKINIDFLKDFKSFIENKIKEGKKFIIVVGGGQIARIYQEAAKKLGESFNDTLDWLGIYATRLNAYLVWTLFKQIAYKKIIINPNFRVNFQEKILIASGWKPGFSTDYDAVILAKNYHSKVIFNLTNIDYIYDKNPKIYPNAKKIAIIKWNDYLKIIENKWSPGMSTPFDPRASHLAKKFKIKCYIINGQNLREFKKALENKKFKGTIIY